MEIAEENWAHNLPDDEYHFEEANHVLIYTPISVITDEDNVSVSLTMDEVEANTVSVIIDHGAPYRLEIRHEGEAFDESLTMNATETLNLHLVSYDFDDNLIDPQFGLWHVFGDIGELDTSESVDVVFTAQKVGTGYIKSYITIEDDTTATYQSANISVESGPLDNIIISLDNGEVNEPSPVNRLDLTAGDEVTLYCHGYDIYENHRPGLVTDDIDWTFTGEELGDLEDQHNGSCLFRALRAYNGGISVTVEGIPSDTLEDVEVNANQFIEYIKIQYSLSGSEIVDTTIVVGNDLELWSVGYDGYGDDNDGLGNRIGSTETDWELSGDDCGDLNETDSDVIVFTGTHQGECTINAVSIDNENATDETGRITVEPTDIVTYLRITKDTDENSEVYSHSDLSADETDTFYLLPYDAYGNLLSDFNLPDSSDNIRWSFTGDDIGNIRSVADHPAEYELEAIRAGSATIRLVAYSIRVGGEVIEDSLVAFSEDVRVVPGAVSSVSMTVDGDELDTLLGDADGEYRFSFIARDSDDNVISYDSMEIAEDDWHHNLPNNDEYYFEEDNHVLFYEPDTIITVDDEVNVSLTVDEVEADMVPVIIRHGAPMYPFTLTPDKLNILAQNEDVNREYFTTFFHSDTIVDQDGNSCDAVAFRITTDLGGFANGEDINDTVFVNTDDEGILSFEFVADTTGGCATVTARESGGPAYGNGRVYISQFGITDIVTEDWSLAQRDTVHVWKGADGITIEITISNLGDDDILLTDVVLNTNDILSRDNWTRRPEDIDVRINGGRNFTVRFIIDIPLDLEAEEIQFGVTASGQIEIEDQDPLILVSVLLPEDGILWLVHPARDASFDNLTPLRVTSGHEARTFSIDMTDQSFDLPDTIRADGTFLRFSNERIHFTTNLIEDEYKLGNENDEATISLDFEGIDIPDNINMSTLLRTNLTFIRSRNPADDITNSIDLDSLEITPQLDLNVPFDSLSPQRITITDDIVFECQIMNRSGIDFIIYPEDVCFFPDRGNQDEAIPLNVELWNEVYDNNVLPDSEWIEFSFEEYHFSSDTWTVEDEYYSQIRIVGIDSNGLEQSKRYDFQRGARERLELFNPTKLEILNNFNLSKCIYGAEYRPSISVLSSGGNLDVVLNSDSTYISFSDGDSSVLQLPIFGDELDRTVNTEEPKTIYFDTLFQELNDHELSANLLYNITLVLNYTDENNFVSKMDTLLTDNFRVFTSEAPIVSEWDISPNPYSSTGTTELIVSLHLFNPVDNWTWDVILPDSLRSSNGSVTISEQDISDPIIDFMPGTRRDLTWKILPDSGASGYFAFSTVLTCEYSIEEYSIEQIYEFSPDDPFPVDIFKPPKLNVFIEKDHNSALSDTSSIVFQFEFTNTGETQIDTLTQQINDLYIEDSTGQIIDNGYLWFPISQVDSLPANQDIKFIRRGILTLNNFESVGKHYLNFKMKGKNHYNRESEFYVDEIYRFSDSLYIINPIQVFIDSISSVNYDDCFSMDQGSIDTLRMWISRNTEPEEIVVIDPSDFKISFCKDNASGREIDSYFRVTPVSDTIIHWGQEVQQSSFDFRVVPKFYCGDTCNVGIVRPKGTVSWNHCRTRDEGLAAGPLKTKIQSNAEVDSNNVVLNIIERAFISIVKTTSSDSSVTCGQNEPWDIDVEISSGTTNESETFVFNTCSLKVYSADDLMDITYSSGFIFDYPLTFLSGDTCIGCNDNPETLRIHVLETGTFSGDMLIVPSVFGRDAIDSYKAQAIADIYGCLRVQVQNTLHLEVDSLKISRVSTGYEGNEEEWEIYPYNQDNHETLPVNNNIYVTGYVKNLGEATAEYKDGHGNWIMGDSTWISFNSIPENITCLESDSMIIVPYNKWFKEQKFRLKKSSDDVTNLICSIIADSMRDANSKVPLISGETAISDTLGLYILEQCTLIYNEPALNIVSEDSNTVELSVTLTNPTNCPIVVYPDPLSPVLKAVPEESVEGKDLNWGEDYSAGVFDTDGLAIDSIQLIENASSVVKWKFFLNINRSIIDYSELLVDMYGDPSNTEKRFTRFKSFYGAPFLWRADCLEDITTEVEILPPYLERVLLLPENSNHEEASDSMETLVAVFSEPIVLADEDIDLKQIFMAHPEILLESSEFNKIINDTMFVRVNIDDVMFQRNEEGDIIKHRLNKDVRIGIDIELNPGILTDATGNNAIGRIYHRHEDNFVSIFPYESEKPLTEAKTVELCNTNLPIFRVRFVDMPKAIIDDCYDITVDSSSGIELSGISIDIFNTTSNEKIPYDSMSISFPEEVLGFAEPGYNLSFLPDISQIIAGDSLRCIINVTDRAGNKSIEDTIFYYANIPLNLQDVSCLYPTPWDPDREPLYFQYQIGEKHPNEIPTLQIFNLNGDWVDEIVSIDHWEQIRGPNNVMETGFHRYRLSDSRRLRELPNGVYIVTLNKSIPGNKSVFTLTVLRGAKTIRRTYQYNE
ncbi:hypothetical protein K9N50_02500 [bacterium]|nr:hypothetical protein [bacterium]